MDNIAIGKRIKYARELRELSLEQVATAVGVARSTIQRYENGKIEKIKIPVLQSIADALRVNPSWLSCKSDEMEAKEPTVCFDNIFPIELKKFPMLGEIACGIPRYANEERECYVMAGANIRADFCLRAHGDSMIGARIYDGDIVFIRKQSIVDNGDIAAVVIDNEATLKRFFYYRERSMLILKAENSSYNDLIYMNEELELVHVLGKAVAFQSDVR